MKANDKYWKQRCKYAEDLINISPINDKSNEAYVEWTNFKRLEVIEVSDETKLRASAKYIKDWCYKNATRDSYGIMTCKCPFFIEPNMEDEQCQLLNNGPEDWEI